MEYKLRDLAYLKYHYGGVARMDDFLTELMELFERELKLQKNDDKIKRALEFFKSYDEAKKPAFSKYDSFAIINNTAFDIYIKAKDLMLRREHWKQISSKIQETT